jgi:hypothetical protein
LFGLQERNVLSICVGYIFWTSKWKSAHRPPESASERALNVERESSASENERVCLGMWDEYTNRRKQSDFSFPRLVILCMVWLIW